ncbi:hypothetical protein [Lysobacter auxotrophicus]|uniref:Uncharacterized protein n=1 Tax=Lysobacter auxotrophicus TaxID=2992573 RepID=A0ABN6UJG8_9GAMM|nr:hypothetical protein [Lysobacter auxotrophicus]BDU16449.1 hypothetical protein LA521A_16500 [Lysobacter auxotrophicus]
MLRPVVGLICRGTALSFGYFSLGKQRKVTRAPQAIGSLACDSSSGEHTGKRETSLDPRLRGDDDQERERSGESKSNININININIKIGSSFRWNDGGVFAATRMTVRCLPQRE